MVAVFMIRSVSTEFSDSVSLVKRQRLPLAILEPFLCGLVAANVEPPRHIGGRVEILVLVDPDLTAVKDRIIHDTIR